MASAPGPCKKRKERGTPNCVVGNSKGGLVRGIPGFEDRETWATRPPELNPTIVRAVTAPFSLHPYPVSMRGKLVRYYGAGDLHFITCRCYRRRALLGTARRRDLFLTVLEEVRRRYQL